MLSYWHPCNRQLRSHKVKPRRAHRRDASTHVVASNEALPHTPAMQSALLLLVLRLHPALPPTPGTQHCAAIERIVGDKSRCTVVALASWTHALDAESPRAWRTITPWAGKVMGATGEGGGGDSGGKGGVGGGAGCPNWRRLEEWLSKSATGGVQSVAHVASLREPNSGGSHGMGGGRASGGSGCSLCCCGGACCSAPLHGGGFIIRGHGGGGGSVEGACEGAGHGHTGGMGVRCSPEVA